MRWLISTRFVPLSDFRRLSPSRAYSTHFRFHSLPLSLSLSPTKITTIPSNGAISISRCTNMSRDRISTLSDCVKEQKFLLDYLVQRGIDFRGCDRVDAFRPSPGKSRLVERLTIPELDFNTLYFMSSFFFFYIYILI